MIPDNARDVFQSLVARSRAGALLWEPTFETPPGYPPLEDYTTIFPEYAVRIAREASGEILVTVLDGQVGRTVIDFTTPRADPDYALLDELLEIVSADPTRRKAALDYLRTALATA